MAKGNVVEREAQELYEAAGYSVFRPQKNRYGPTDMFGLYDFLAAPYRVSGERLPILGQVKSNQTRGAKEHFKESLDLFDTEHVEIHYLVRLDGEGGHHPTPPRWKVAVPTEDAATVGNYTWAVDERDEDVPADGEGVVRWLKRHN